MIGHWFRVGAALGLAFFAACSDADDGRWLEDITANAGITFEHRTGALGNRELPETMGAGVGVLDADGDGDLDLYFVQSGPVRLPASDAATNQDRSGAANELWLNDGTARFSAAPAASAAADTGYGQGVAVGDADGDGRDDLYVLNWGTNELFMSDGAAGFTARSDAHPAADAWSVAAAFVDIDADGDLDLYEVNYVVSPPASHTDPKINADAPRPFDFYPHPDLFSAEPDRLLINDGAGRYGDQTAVLIAPGPAGKGLGVAATDVELDGWIDLYVTNDSTPNFLLHNSGGLPADDSLDGEPLLARVGRAAGVAFNDDGMTEAGMGVDTGDVDFDLDFDLFATNLDSETNTLYLNESTPTSVRFRDRTRTAGLSGPSRPWVGFGTLFSDLDADGALDVMVVNGHIMENIGELSDTRTFAQPAQLFRGDGAGNFAEAATATLAPGLESPRVGRGLVCADLDGDDVPDFVISTNGGEPAVFRGRARGLVSIALAGPPGNPRGLGASVIAEFADGSQRLGRVESARSYASAVEAVATFALTSKLTSVEVIWPGGERERFDVASDAESHVLVRGDGR